MLAATGSQLLQALRLMTMTVKQRWVAVMTVATKRRE
jgi:hypothetical protein